MLRLVGNFLNSVGNKHTFSMKDPDPELNPAKVKESMELLASLDIFEKDGIKLFQEPISAKYVETVETPIFDGETLFGEPNQSPVLNQTQLNISPVVSDFTKTAVIPVEINEKINTNSLKVDLKHNTYQPILKVPQVSLDKPILVETVSTEPNVILKESLKKEQPNFYARNLNMIRQDNMGFTKRALKENPSNPPAGPD